MNTNLHVTRQQAESLLAAVEFESMTRLGELLAEGGPRRRLDELAANRSMLLAALARIGELERRRAPHLRVATAGGPGVRDGHYSADWLA